MQTLPADDPWRSISAVVFDDDGTCLVREVPGETPPTATGAVMGGVRFGSFVNGSDIYGHPLDDPWVDPASAVLIGPVSAEDDPPGNSSGLPGLDPRAAAILGFAGGDLSPLVDAITVVLETFEGAAAVGLWSDAMRWASWRRRVYAGSDDSCPAVAMMAWALQADLQRAGQWDPAEHEAAIEYHRIPDGTWKSLRNYLNEIRSKPKGAPGTFLSEPDGEP